MSAIADAQRLLDGLASIARSIGLKVPDGITVGVDPGIQPGAAAVATFREGRPVILLRALPDALDCCDAIDLRGVLCHELAHHVAGLRHWHREPFRRVLATLARACCQPLPDACDSNPIGRAHPKRWIGCARMPTWLRGGPPRRMSQIRRALGVAPMRQSAAPIADFTPCSPRAALLLTLPLCALASALAT